MAGAGWRGPFRSMCSGRPQRARKCHGGMLPAHPLQFKQDPGGRHPGRLRAQDLKLNLVSELAGGGPEARDHATALATAPKLLLLDEVAAGLNPSEIEDIMAGIRTFIRISGSP